MLNLSTSKNVTRIIVEPVEGKRGTVRLCANAYLDWYDTSWKNANPIVVVEGARKDIKKLARTVINELHVSSVLGCTVTVEAMQELERLAA